jgi:hypothetical protein
MPARVIMNCMCGRLSRHPASGVAPEKRYGTPTPGLIEKIPYLKECWAITAVELLAISTI